MFTHKYLHGRAQLSKFAATAAVACGFAVTLPAVAASQQPAPRVLQLDARWQPWVGCWRPAAPQMPGVTFSAPRSGDAPLVCVVPAADMTSSSSVNVVTVANGKIVSTDTIDATGQKVARSKDGCTGVERAEWSTDGRRLYVSSDFTCPGNLKRTSSGLFAMSPQGDWVNIQSVDAGGNQGVHTLHYTDAGIPSGLPSDIADALRTHSIVVNTARSAAGARLTTANVVEASHKLDPVVVEAWIVDRGQGFAIDAKQVVALADAGVPGNVTDAMVAVTYPKAFTVNHADDESGLANIEAAQGEAGSGIDRSNLGDVRVMMMPGYSRYNYSPFGYSPYDYYGYGYSPYGYSPFGYSPYGYSPYGGYYSQYSRFGGAYGGWYSPPIIVLRGNNEASLPRGTAVKGRGYTRTAPRNGGSSGTDGATASPRPTVSSPPAQPAPKPSQPASTGRTAHERP